MQTPHTNDLADGGFNPRTFLPFSCSVTINYVEKKVVFKQSSAFFCCTIYSGYQPHALSTYWINDVSFITLANMIMWFLAICGCHSFCL